MQLQRCSHTEASAALVLECTSTQQDMMEVLQLHTDSHYSFKRGRKEELLCNRAPQRNKQKSMGCNFLMPPLEPSFINKAPRTAGKSPTSS